MNAEAPIIVIETDAAMSDGEKKKWFKQKQSEGTQKGATWHRFCHHPTSKSRLLYEGWKREPADKPVARWKED